MRQRIHSPQIECLDRKARSAMQDEGLRRAVARAIEGSSFYAQWLGRAPEIRRGRVGLETLSELPFTTRESLVQDQRDCPPFGRRHLVDVAEAALAGRSGVTFSVSGQRLNILATARDVAMQGNLVARALWEAGVRPGECVYLAADPRYNVMAMYAMRAVDVLGALCVYTGAEKSARTARYVVPMLPPDHVFASPSYARYLPVQLAEASSRRWPVKSVSGWGEPGYSIRRVRAAIELQWAAVSSVADVAIVDIYGLSEIGMVAFGCRDGHGAHVVEDAVVSEIVDPNTERVLAAGERGEVTITLIAPGSAPLVRYRTGDLATMIDEPCACGRTGRRLVGIERATDVVVLAGRRIYPSDVEDALERSGVELENFVLVRRAPGGERLAIRGYGLRSSRASSEVAAAVGRILGVPVSLELVAPEALRFSQKTMAAVDLRTEETFDRELASQRELEGHD